jgi:hypothetical protein
MTQHLNPKLRAGFTPEAAGAVYLDRQITNLNDPVEVPAGIANGDQLQIGVIPAGTTLIPELSTLHLAIFDTNVAPTATGTVGTAAGPADIAAVQTLSGAVVNLRGSSLGFSALPGTTPPLGSPDTDIPIFITFTHALATQATSGQVVCDLAFRAFNPNLDPQ